MFFGRRFVPALLALAFFPVTLSAAGRITDGQKHSLRIGWGDMLFETALYSPTATHVFDNPSGLPDSYRVQEGFGLRLSGHIFAEYSYRLGELVSIGAMLDYGNISCKNGIFDKYHNMTEALPDIDYHNLVFMPTVRFTYFRKGLVSMYSGLGAGLLMSISGKAEFAPALNLNCFGVQVGDGHWSGAVDLGMLNAMNGTNKVYLFASRIVSVSINYSW